MTETAKAVDAAAPAKPKTAKKPKEKVQLDVVKLTHLARLIEDHKGGNLTDLIHRLEGEEGLKVTKKKDVTVTADMAGVSATSGHLISEWVAIENWANAARRAVRSAA